MLLHSRKFSTPTKRSPDCGNSRTASSWYISWARTGSLPESSKFCRTSALTVAASTPPTLTGRLPPTVPVATWHQRRMRDAAEHPLADAAVEALGGTPAPVDRPPASPVRFVLPKPISRRVGQFDRAVDTA